MNSKYAVCNGCGLLVNMATGQRMEGIEVPVHDRKDCFWCKPCLESREKDIWDASN